MKVFSEEVFKRSLPVKFTEDEVRAKADELANKITRRAQLESAKKNAMADFKARGDELDAQIGLLARHVSEKQEYQPVECYCILDHPKYGQKTIIRRDTGEIASVETMTSEDRQTVFEFERDTTKHPNPLETPEQAAPKELEDIANGAIAGDGIAEQAEEEPEAEEEPVEHDTGGISHEAEDENVLFLPIDGEPDERG